MVSHAHVAFRAEDRSYFAIIKKEIHALAASAGFSEAKVGRIDIIVAEMVSNLVKHAGGGQLLVKLIQTEEAPGIEIMSVDNGPGMTDVNRMLADGYSSKNTLGNGLGAMKRLADLCEIYSLKEWGTIILTRIFDKELPTPARPPRADVRTLLVPKPGEQKCGDGACVVQTADYLKIFLGDGLGHGDEAARAVDTATEAFSACASNDPVEIIRHLDLAVKKTRGLVGAVAVFPFRARKWRICAVGNISIKVNGPTKPKNYMSYNGIIGLNVPNTLNAQEVEYEKGQYLIMCSDGLKSRWDTLRYTGILRYDPSILAAALWKDYARQTDDMSVLTCKINL